MPRLPDVTREQINPEDLAEFDEVIRLRNNQLLVYTNLLYSPKMAGRINALNQFFPLESVMGRELGSEEHLRQTQREKGVFKRAKLMEVVILAATREIDCQFAFTGHAKTAREEGVSEDTIRAIAQGTAPQGLSGDEEMVVRFTQELVRDCKISDGTFNRVKDRFGVQWTVELTGLVCYYLMFGHLLMAFEQELPSGVAPELPL